MTAPSPAIDIVTPSRHTSSSPRNQASNLTSQLQNAPAAVSGSAMDLSNNTPRDNTRPAAGRQDSLGFGLNSVSGARPINGAQRPNSNSGNVGSFVGGMSWGGLSVGSWLQDDIMTGTSPNPMQSPSLHSSSYLPKMEANFWNNLRCCDQGFKDLHELLQHYEDQHRSSQPGSGMMFRRKSSFAGMGGTSFGNSTNHMRAFQPSSLSMSSNNNNTSSKTAQAGGDSRLGQSAVQDMDTIGEMEMDYDQDGVDGDFGSQPLFPQTPSQFGSASSRPTPINPGLANIMPGQQANASSNPPTPLTARQTLPMNNNNNPTVSSVNTPALTPSTGHSKSPGPINDGFNMNFSDVSLGDEFTSTNGLFNTNAMTDLNSEFGNMGFRKQSDMVDLCIRDPAKALFSDGGGFNPQHASNFDFVNGAMTNPDDPAGAMQAPNPSNALAGGFPGEEHRPFKCMVIGCEKAYKNANGLRYHEKHGHASQKLKENPDGTLSILDPATSLPYPGTVGMEKEKPYKCDVCGKRYKNLNGLKYHRNHSPPCNPDYNFATAALPSMQASLAGDAVF